MPLTIALVTVEDASNALILEIIGHNFSLFQWVKLRSHAADD